MGIIFTVSMDQESGSSFAEWFWLEIFHQVAVSIVACRWEGLVQLEDCSQDGSLTHLTRYC